MNELNQLSKKFNLLSTKSYNILLVRTCFTVDDSYQIFLVFAPILSCLKLDNKKKFTNWIYQLDYHPKKLNHLMLILPQP